MPFKEIMVEQEEEERKIPLTLQATGTTTQTQHTTVAQADVDGGNPENMVVSVKLAWALKINNATAIPELRVAIVAGSASNKRDLLRVRQRRAC